MLDIDRIVEMVRAFLGSMDDIFSLIFVLTLVFTFLDGSIRKKNKSSMPTGLPPSDDEFNVLPLDDGRRVEVTEQVRTKAPKVERRQSKKYEPIQASTPPPVKEKDIRAELSAEDAREAMILKEIFDKPKSLRRR